MESEELLKNKVLYDLMEEQGLIGCHGTLNPHLSCYALGHHTTSVKVLHEEDEKPMPWSVFEVDFGKPTEGEGTIEFENSLAGQRSRERAKSSKFRVSGQDKETDDMDVDESAEPQFATRKRASGSCGTVSMEEVVERAGKERYKFAILHTHNQSSWHAVYGPAKKLYAYCINHQVDFICGDGNQHYQFHSKTHKNEIIKKGLEADTGNGLFNMILRGYVEHVNSGRPMSHRMSYWALDNNTVESMTSQTDVDCIFCHVLSFGKQDCIHDAREKTKQSTTRYH